MEYEEARLRNRKHVRIVALVDMAIAVGMIVYFAYKFANMEMRDLSRPPFSPGKWRGFAEFIFAMIMLTYSIQLFIAFLLLSSTNRMEKIENACVKNQVWVCTSHFLLILLGVECFILVFNVIRPGATSEQIVIFGSSIGICILKFVFRVIGERFVKAYLADIYDVPGVHLSDRNFFAASAHSINCPSYQYKYADDKKDSEFYDIV